MASLGTSTATTWGTYTINVPTTQVSTGELHQRGEPKDPPKGLISTTGVLTRRGWIGQVVVNGSIVYETEPFLTDDSEIDRDDCMESVNRYVLDRIAYLFSEDFQPAPVQE